MKLGVLEEIKDLRTIWPHEALNFTPWVAENIELLGESVGIDITVEETESSVGDFNVDIFATETGTERKIIIENQLEETDHDHLGKLITYASGKAADVIIWVVRHAREEHKAAIEWLNNHTDEQIGFFLCEIKLFKIGDSEIAPAFTVVERPNDWTKEIRTIANSSPTRQLRLEYWQSFIECAFDNNVFAKEFKKRKPGPNHWYTLSIGSSLCSLSILRLQKKNSIGMELYIQDDKELFKLFLQNKEEIESATELKFDWKELPEKRASRIVIEVPAELDNRDKWTEQFTWMIDVALKMKRAFSKYLN